MDTIALRRQPSKLFVETTTRCNLNCVMCVKQAEGCGIVEGDLPWEVFEAITPVLPTLEALILNGVGEPLLHPLLEDFIRRARQRMPATSWIGFQSNGLLLDELRAIALIKAGLGKICLSLDAASPGTFTKIREGGQLSAMDRAFEAIANAKAALGTDSCQVGIEFVVMPGNLHELAPALQWAAARGASFAIVTHALPYTAHDAAAITYEVCSAEAIELFKRWQVEAATAAIDLYDYPRAIWKYSKSPADLKVIQLVALMKAEAEEAGIQLDLKRLFSLDLGRLQRVEGVFREARRTAEAHGIALSLPALCLKEERQCDFVEEGGMFISWDGEVFPCYFLWHHYHCYASGWRQTVKPRSFGRLGDRNILDIWNSETFRQFRTNVTRYDYPYCASCSLSPCDYIQTSSFEQDCHINEEPCGSCLWCMGIFQCLR